MKSIRSVMEEIPQQATRKLAEADPRARDRIVSAVGAARKTLPLKASRVAAQSGHSESQESRIRNGQRMNETARAAIACYLAAEKEATGDEQEGVTDAMVEVVIRTVSMWPKLERLSTDELHNELRREIARFETRANSVCNDIDAQYLENGTLDPDAMATAHTRQAMSSTRIAAINQILSGRA